MSTSLWISLLVVPVAVLLVDLGRRRLTALRLLRPLIMTAVIVPFVAPKMDLAGKGLDLEIGACVAGVLLGLLAAACMRVERAEASGNSLVTVAGLAYALVWVAFALARLAFVWETENNKSFARQLGQWLMENHISVAAFADAIMFLGFAMLIAHRAALYVRGRSVRARGSVSRVGGAVRA